MALDRWDAPNGSYTSVVPPGMVAFRKVIAQHFGYSRTEVIRDASRCRQTRSEHCECGGVDCFTTDTVKGRLLFDWCVDVANPLGVQSVIFQHRQIGFGNPVERNRDKADHMDHVHIGLNRWARVNLTEAMVRGLLPGQEDDLPYTEAQLKKIIGDVVDEKLTQYVGAPYVDGLTTNKMLTEKVGDKFVDGIGYLRGIIERIATKVGA